MNLLLQFVIALVGTLAFAILFNAPRNTILFCALAGAAGWSVNQLFLNFFSPSVAAATLAGSIAVAVCSEIFARVFKNPVTVYIIPGIIPLVPGMGIYSTMAYLLDQNISQGMTELLSTFFNAAAIAVGLLLVSGVVRAVTGKDYRRPGVRKQG